VVARAFARKGRPTRQLRNPALILGLMLLARLIFFPLLVLGNRFGRGDCLLVVASQKEEPVMNRQPQVSQ
jgi:hypothetical protein